VGRRRAALAALDAVRHALVTGANGVVGRWLVAALLERGTAVTTLARGGRAPDPRCTARAGSVTDAGAVARAVAGCEAVFHLAAQSLTGAAREDPVGTFDTNVRGTWTVLEACRVAGVERVVVAGTGATPWEPYGASKACAALVAHAYADSYGLPVAVARTANVYGPGDREPSRLVPNLVASVTDGRAPVLRSDGSPRRDFLFAADAAAAYLAIADALPGVAGETFAVATGEPASVREVVDLLLAITGADVTPEYLGQPEAPAPERVDAAPLRALGWAPSVGLREGLEQTVAWHRAAA
jgi:CDP-glucose 4,6-dehydratase